MSVSFAIKASKLPTKRDLKQEMSHRSMSGSRKFSQGGGGGGGEGVQIPRRGLTENFNMAKINNLAIPGSGGGGGSGTPVPRSGSAHAKVCETFLLNFEF